MQLVAYGAERVAVRPVAPGSAASAVSVASAAAAVEAQPAAATPSTGGGDTVRCMQAPMQVELRFATARCVATVNVPVVWTRASTRSAR